MDRTPRSRRFSAIPPTFTLPDLGGWLGRIRPSLVALVRVFPILIAFAASQQALAQDEPEGAEPEAAATAPEPPPSNAARWIPPQPEQVKEVNEKGQEPLRVRIGLRLTPFKKVVTRNRDGTSSTRFVPAEPLRHTLRAQLNKSNHFFIGDYHVETTPTKWVRKSRRYEVKISVFRRYGAFGQLEENIGAVEVSGVLEEQEANIHVLLGVARQRLRDKFGNPVLDIVAGFSPGAAPGTKISRGPSKVTEAPTDAEGALIRGRF